MSHDGPVTIATGAAADELLVTGEAVAVEVRPTSFVLRAAGAAIDVAVTCALALLTLWALSALDVFGQIEEAYASVLSIALIVFFLVALPTVVETASGGRSLGKLAIGSRIVRDDGGAIQGRHAFIRALLGVLEIYLTLGALAAIVGLMSGRAKRLGDLVAGTYSRHERVPRPTSRTFAVPPHLADWARTVDVARMPDALSRRVAHFLAHAPNMTDVSRVRLSSALANEVAAFVHPLPPAGPMDLLVAVAALRTARESVALSRQTTALDRVAPNLTLPRGFPDRG